VGSLLDWIRTEAVNDTQKWNSACHSLKRFRIAQQINLSVTA